MDHPRTAPSNEDPDIEARRPKGDPCPACGTLLRLTGCGFRCPNCGFKES